MSREGYWQTACRKEHEAKAGIIRGLAKLDQEENYSRVEGFTLAG